MTTFADLVDKFTAPAPNGARIIEGSAMKDDGALAAKPTPKQEPPMPRGVYDRTKKANGSPPPEKKKRKYALRAKALPNGDLRSLAVEALSAAGKHLAATVRMEVEGMEENPALHSAVRSFELAEKIVAAAGA